MRRFELRLISTEGRCVTALTLPSANLDGVAKQGSDPAGDRQANNALHTIARIRARHDEPTCTYLERRISEGKTPSEAMRALKRHLSRSLYRKLITIPLT